MRRLLLAFLTPLLLTMLWPGRAVDAARGDNPSVQEPDSGAVLCSPSVYPAPQDECLPLGPAQFLADMAAQGIAYPIQPLPAYAPPTDLGNIPYQYFRVNVENAALYFFPSQEEAMANETSGSSIGPGRLIYVSYLNRAKNDQGVFYYLRNFSWIRGNIGSPAALPNPFQGLQFSSTPRNAFGWVLDEIKSRSAPGFNASYTGKTYYRFNIVQVYATQMTNDNEWDLIGPDEWVEGRQVATVTPRQNQPVEIPAPVTRWIEINLAEQTMAVYQDNRLVFATAVSTGMPPFWTRPGPFQIYLKKDSELMQGAFEADKSDLYYLDDVPWTMYYDESRALHGAYWHSMFGYVTSHGCVNISLGDSHWLYDWAKEGDWVYVYDPSGKTPTDPTQYGAGAP